MERCVKFSDGKKGVATAYRNIFDDPRHLIQRGREGVDE